LADILWDWKEKDKYFENIDTLEEEDKEKIKD